MSLQALQAAVSLWYHHTGAVCNVLCFGAIIAINVHHRNAVVDSDINLQCFYVPLAFQQCQALAQLLVVEVQVATL